MSAVARRDEIIAAQEPGGREAMPDRHRRRRGIDRAADAESHAEDDSIPVLMARSKAAIYSVQVWPYCSQTEQSSRR